MRLLTQISQKNYLHKIRLQFSTYVYDCGMLCENTTKLLLRVDEILSYGNMDIKTKRKQLVNKIQLFQSYLSKLHVFCFFIFYLYVATIKESKHLV